MPVCSLFFRPQNPLPAHVSETFWPQAGVDPRPDRPCLLSNIRRQGSVTRNPAGAKTAYQTGGTNLQSIATPPLGPVGRRAPKSFINWTRPVATKGRSNRARPRAWRLEIWPNESIYLGELLIHSLGENFARPLASMGKGSYEVSA